MPVEAVEETPAPEPDPIPAPTLRESAPAASGEALNVDALRTAVVQALAQGGHQSASTLLSSGNWTLDAGNLKIEVAGLGKKMLALTINAAAEKIIRAELQRLNGPARFLVVPGEGVAAGATAAAAPLAGSVQEEALKNPLVQKAKEIFHAEVRSVVDLRIK